VKIQLIKRESTGTTFIGDHWVKISPEHRERRK